MKTWQIRGLLISGVVLAVILLMVLMLAKPAIPPRIKNQLTSTLLLPTRHAEIDHDTIKYDAKLKLLSFYVTAFDQRILISQQPTPETFTDAPQVYEKVINHMREYKKFETDIGTVHLTQPPDTKGGQTAVLNTKGTLLFAKPSGQLTPDQWRQLFAGLRAQS
jgi:hypothetical protein